MVGQIATAGDGRRRPRWPWRPRRPWCRHGAPLAVSALLSAPSSARACSAASVPRLAAGAFALTVGASIARSYTLYDLPPDIVRIAPEYEDYRYVLVDDDIVIVDPDTYEIVDVIRG